MKGHFCIANSNNTSVEEVDKSNQSSYLCVLINQPCFLFACVRVCVCVCVCVCGCGCGCVEFATYVQSS